MLTPTQAIAVFLNRTGRLEFRHGWRSSADANVALSVVLTRAYGASGVIAATVLSDAVINLVPTAIVMVRTARAMSPGEGAA